MIKTNSTIVSSIFAFGVLYMALFGQAAFAEEVLPETATVIIHYQDTEEGYNWEAHKDYDESYYEAGVTSPWCSHYTPGRFPREYDHCCELDDGFPYYDTTHSTWVTKQKATWFDEDYYVGWTKEADPTCAYNCHTYAMDGPSNTCIASTCDGSDRWLEDSGYESINEPVDDCIKHTTGHTDLIEYVWYCPPPEYENLIKKVSSKNGAQGIYSVTYEDPGDAEDASWNHNNLYAK